MMYLESSFWYTPVSSIYSNLLQNWYLDKIKFYFKDVLSYAVQVINIKMYLQRISVKMHCNLPTLGLLRIIELS